jgi:hypothetical protein
LDNERVDHSSSSAPDNPDQGHPSAVLENFIGEKLMSALTVILRKRLMPPWLWQTLFVLAVIAGFVSHHLTVSKMMSRIRFVAMDSRGTFYLANLGSFETAQQIHAEHAKMAAETIFSRNPNGFDNPERLDRLSKPATTASLQKDAGRDAEIFRSQQIHQKIETGQIKELGVDNNTALVSVEGQILI